MKLYISILLSTFLLACDPVGNNQTSLSEKPGLDTTTDIYSVEAEDISMNAAIETAKKTIGDFDKALQSKNSAYADFAIKKGYSTDDGGAEHVWIADVKIINGNYQGIVNNDVEGTNQVKFGDTVIVKKEDISDWMYIEDNKLRGGYTIRAIRNKLNKQDRIKMDEELSFKIED